jgi:hypothetical protein
MKTSVEVYYKPWENQIEYRNGYIPKISKKILRRNLLVGMELWNRIIQQKTRGRLTGWVGY